MYKSLLRHWHSIVIFSGLMAILAIIFALIPYQINDDAWYHLKTGEVFVKNGLLFHDVFSFAAQGREWFPGEWLFQVIIFLITKYFGFLGLRIFTYSLGLLQASIIYLLCRKVFKLNDWLAVIVSFFYFSINFLTFIDRPYLLANVFLLINLSFLLLYFLKSKNFLFLTLPFTLLWANSHSSIFIDVYLFGSYCGIAFLNFIITKEKVWRNKTLVLVSYTILTFILTILPPLGFNQYRLLLFTYSKLHLLQQFIEEWMPLSQFPGNFWRTVLLNISTLFLFFFISFKQRTLKKSLWVLPLVFLMLVSYSALRNIFFNYASLSIIFAWVLSSLSFKKILRFKKIILAIVLLGFTAWNILPVYVFAPMSNTPPYPDKAIEFIQAYDLKGNMFNQFGLGSYLIYKLYPQRKVFIDLRTDVYACCELVDYYSLIQKKYAPDSSYKVLLDRLWKKYNISYFIADTQANTVQEKIGRILINDPSWSLVYWDDASQVFVRNDGKNTKLLTTFFTKAASPYNISPIRDSNLDLALKEYERMIKITDSAHSRNAIGYILLKEGKTDQAEGQFTKAIQLDNAFDSPYMNLGEISLSKGDLETAIDLYKKALSLNSGRAFTYIRLGQLYLKNNDVQDAKAVWQNGLANIQDQTDQQTFKQLLQTIY